MTTNKQPAQAPKQHPLPDQPAAGGAAPAPAEKKQARPVIVTNPKVLSQFLNQNAKELEAFAKGFMRPEAMIRMAVLATVKTPELNKCTLSSILRALMDSSALRIRPGGLNGRGYLVPRKNRKVTPEIWEAHFDPGWRGLIDVARRSRMIKSIGAQVVRDGDEFSYGYHPLPTLNWTPSRESEDGRPIVAAFAVAELSDGAVQIEVLEAEDLRKIKAASAAGDSGPWASWESEMCRKSAVKRLCKYLPVPDDFDELDRAMALADGADTGERLIDVPGEEIPLGESVTQAEEIRNQLAEPGMSAMDQLEALEREQAEAVVR